MRRIFAVAALAFVPAGAIGQKLDLTLEAIASRASEKSEVDMDSASLAAAQKLTGKVPANLAGLTEVHVRAYEFAKAGAYSDQELDPIRKQVGPGSGWNRIVSVKDKSDTVEVYMFTAQGKAGGFLVLAGEPKELTVVHVVGDLTVEKLHEIVKSDIKYDLKSVLAAAASNPAPR
jgi:hypothetical protein